MSDKKPVALKDITEEELEKISGGLILDTEGRAYSKYVIIDDKMGSALAYSDYYDYADTMADARDVSSRLISLKEYEEIFGKKYPTAY